MMRHMPNQWLLGYRPRTGALASRRAGGHRHRASGDGDPDLEPSFFDAPNDPPYVWWGDIDARAFTLRTRTNTESAAPVGRGG